MQRVITGKAYVLGDNIDTDQIIPAQYLTFNPSIPDERKYVRHVRPEQRAAGAGRAAQGARPVPPRRRVRLADYTIIVGGKNFGCGSSREHAPLALAAAGIKAVVAEFYARIFFRNSVNGGYLVPFECGDRLCDRSLHRRRAARSTSPTACCSTDHDRRIVQLKPLGDVGPIIEAGGVFPYAKKVGMLPA